MPSSSAPLFVDRSRSPTAASRSSQRRSSRQSVRSCGVGLSGSTADPRVTLLDQLAPPQVQHSVGSPRNLSKLPLRVITPTSTCPPISWRRVIFVASLNGIGLPRRVVSPCKGRSEFSVKRVPSSYRAYPAASPFIPFAPCGSMPRSFARKHGVSEGLLSDLSCLRSCNRNSARRSQNSLYHAHIASSAVRYTAAMANRDPRVDAYIAKSPAFAKPILEYVRDCVHAALPEVEETMKWSTPFFDWQGPLPITPGPPRRLCGSSTSARS